MSIKSVLKGHISNDTAIVVDNYPYGSYRTKIRYWIETTKRGTRFCSQTLNPKTNLWNKPKKSTYSPIMVMYIDEKDHVTYSNLYYYDEEGKINKFIENYKEGLTENDYKEIKCLIAMDRGQQHYEWNIKDDDGSPRQTLEEQQKIINRATAYEYSKIK